MRLPEHRGGGVVECRKIYSFPGERSVEGLAKMPSGPFLYVIDRDHNVHLRFLLPRMNDRSVTTDRMTTTDPTTTGCRAVR